MQLTQLSAVIVVVGVALAVAVAAWRRGVRRINPEARYRQNIQALKRRGRTTVRAVGSDDVWEAGAQSDAPHSRAKKATTWVTLGAVGGCGGCGGCGCGG
jgi:hypothetical protein